MRPPILFRARARLIAESSAQAHRQALCSAPFARNLVLPGFEKRLCGEPLFGASGQKGCWISTGNPS
jgi:hypothetical protein